jgi:hypothetical protein
MTRDEARLLAQARQSEGDMPSWYFRALAGLYQYLWNRYW